MRLLATLAFLALFLSGCTSVANLHPLYSPEVRTEEPALAGDWFLDPNEPPVVRVHPPPLPEASWTVYITSNGVSGNYSGDLLRLGDFLFIELTPKDPEALHSSALWLPAPHSFYRLQLTGDTLVVRPIDAQWLEKRLRREHSLAYKNDRQHRQLMLLGSTLELQAFLRVHAADSSAFRLSIPLTRDPADRQNQR